MKILAIESSAKTASVAVVSQGVLVGEYTINTKMTHSQTLLPMLDELLDTINISIEDMDAIAVSKGPGSFTGLRIGAATAKGLALALEIPVIAVPTVDVLAYNLVGTDKLVCPLMDARRGQTYSGLYRFEGESLVEVLPQCALSISEIIEKINEYDNDVIFLGDGVSVFKDIIEKECKVRFSFAACNNNMQRAASLAALAEIYAKADKLTDADDFRPVYLRRSQAERERINMLSQSLREAKEDDIPQLVCVASSGQDTKWSKEDFEGSLKSTQSKVLVVESADSDKIIGYVVFNYAADQGDIMSVAVSEDYRKKGYAKTLLNSMIEQANLLGVKSVFLEVRNSNEPAIRLYESAGFEHEGIRKSFYSEPVEDAIIMRYDIR